jgi:hypothetical protein
MENNYVNNHPGHSWEEYKITEREKEILSYTRCWFWGGTHQEQYLMRKLLERIHKLEDEIVKLKENV